MMSFLLWSIDRDRGGRKEMGEGVWEGDGERDRWRIGRARLRWKKEREKERERWSIIYIAKALTGTSTLWGVLRVGRLLFYSIADVSFLCTSTPSPFNLWCVVKMPDGRQTDCGGDREEEWCFQRNAGNNEGKGIFGTMSFTAPTFPRSISYFC